MIENMLAKHIRFLYNRDMLFESGTIYRFDADGDIDVDNHPVDLLPETAPPTINEACSRPLLASGIKLGEFALFATLIDMSGIVTEAFLVTDRCNDDDATIAAYDTIVREPQLYVTRHLITAIRSIDPYELDQFNMTELVGYINEHFPQS